MSTVAALVARSAAATPTAPALLAPGCPPSSYADLRRHVDGVGAALRRAGVGRADAVAVVLPNGPAMAATFLGVAAAAKCAPLDPASPAPEAVAAFRRLGVRAVVAAAGGDTAARRAASELGLAVLESAPSAAEPLGPVVPVGAAGSSDPAAEVAPAVPSDVALLLGTSGTTGQPKVVPLTHANLCASATNVARTLALTAQDRCLNLMPLFHVHGLVACLLASLRAGGSIVCTPGFDGGRFAGWVGRSRPTWYSAVPTIHQAVLGAVADRAPGGAGPAFRFVRSSSAPLPPSLLARLEAAFGAPVVEAYGMTEAAHQITSNPLPPGLRRPGTVGPAAGPEVAVLGPDGGRLGPGEVGEIGIRGPNVTSGYLRAPEANAAAFTPAPGDPAGPWLRTGDQGVLDADGYLTITGRLKELVNRGGEKVAPREVEEALLDHPAVAEALAFAVPHPTLGEDVGAAVVLAAGAGDEPTVGELRRFAGRTLAPYKVPRRLVVVDAIPRGPTGKLQRRGLAEALGLTGGSSPPTTPSTRRTPHEAALAGLWQELLGVAAVRPDDDFFELGGDSLTALELREQVGAVFGVDLPVEVFDDGPTLANVAAALAGAPRRPVDGTPPAARRSLGVGRWRRSPLRPPSAAFEPGLAERWHGDLRLLVGEGAEDLGVVVAFSDRSGGVSPPPYDSANLSLQSGDDPANVLENRRRVAAAAGLDVHALTLATPVFGAGVVEAGRRQRGLVGTGDVLVARTSGPVLALLYADCTPLVVVGAAGVGLVHASRSGVTAGVVERAVAAVGPVWAAWIGPSVRGCCDAVTGDVADGFEAQGLPVIDRSHVDVPDAVVAALAAQGVTRVAVSAACTQCDDRWFSRRTAVTTGRQGAFVAVRPDVDPVERLLHLGDRALARARRAGGTGPMAGVVDGRGSGS